MVQAEFHKALIAHETRPAHIGLGRRPLRRRWPRPHARPVKVDAHMLGAKHDVHGRPIRHTRCQKPAKGRHGQRPLNCGPQPVRIAEKRDRGAIDRPRVNIIRRTALHDLTIAHQRNFVGHAHRFIRLMRHQKDAGILLLEDRQSLVADAVAQAVVETRKRLIHQHDPRTRGQGPGQRHTLLFPPRQLMRVHVDETAHMDPLQHLFDPGTARILGARQPVGHIACNAQMRKQGKVLKHQANLAPFRRDTIHRVADQGAIDVNLARILHFDTCNHAQRGGLAAARRADKDAELAVLDFQVHVKDDLGCPVFLDRLVQCYACHGSPLPMEITGLETANWQLPPRCRGLWIASAAQGRSGQTAICAQ
mmetsp:Transcript_23679/g.42234  ORF Transcript_23679/g.42234 Transcript_23679/m.42234 type:complete len:364 (+) Transcript_23679:741-1832(+)